MSKTSNLPPSGTRDFLPDELSLRSSVFAKIENICQLKGFNRIETPAVENLEAISGKYGEESEKLIFKILKRGDKAVTGEADMALRYDLTVPAMRFYAKNKEILPKIFKRYQYGPVWRADRPGKGRYREFFQFDFDIYGSASILADVECMRMLADSLTALDINEFTINLNSREILTSLMNSYNIPESVQPDIIRSMDKIDKVGIDGFITEITSLDISTEIKDALANDFSDSQFAQIARERVSESGAKWLNEIDTMISLVAGDFPQAIIRFDPFLARGLDYYTGPIYEVTSPYVKGSIAAGGRYDKLSRLFLNEDIPVCGSSLGIERILLLLDKKTDVNAPKVYVGTWSDKYKTFEIATTIRKSGVSAEINLLNVKIGKQISYAAKLGCQYFVFQGPDEKQNDSIVIKNLITSSQEIVPLYEISDFLI